MLNTDAISPFQTNVGFPQTNWNLFQTNTSFSQNNFGFPQTNFGLPQTNLNFTGSLWSGNNYLNTLPGFSNTQGWTQVPQNFSYPTTFVGNATNNLTGFNVVNTIAGIGSLIGNRVMSNYYPTSSQQNLPQTIFSFPSPMNTSSFFNPSSLFQFPQSTIQFSFQGGFNNIWQWPFTLPSSSAPSSTAPSQTTITHNRLFEVSHTNYAWGYYQHSGFFIDDDGKVYSFESTSANSGDTITYEMTIDSLVLAQKQSLIEPASAGSYSDRTNTAYDAGTTLYVCHSGNTQITLAQTGDWSYKNQSQSAQDLVAWLNEIWNQIN